MTGRYHVLHRAGGHLTQKPNKEDSKGIAGPTRQTDSTGGSDIHDSSTQSATLMTVAATKTETAPILVRNCTCRIQIGGVSAFVLIDTGSMVTIVNPERLKIHSATLSERPDGVVLKSASGHEIPITHEAALEFSFGREIRKHVAFVCPNIRQDAIIGFDFIREHNVRIDAADQSIQVANSGRIPLQDATEETARTLAGLCITQAKLRRNEHLQTSEYGAEDRPADHPAGTTNGKDGEESDQDPAVEPTRKTRGDNDGKEEVRPPSDPSSDGNTPRGEQEPRPSQPTRSVDNSGTGSRPPDRPPQGTKGDIAIGPTSPEERERLLHLVNEYPECFAWNGELGRCDLIQHRINVTTDEPVRRPAYKVAHKDREVIENEVREMLEKGVIEPSISPYAAGVVLVPKKSGETRFCVDYRGLNQVTKADHYPLPLARTEIFDTLGQAKIFSCLDCQQGYWQVGIAKEDRHKTAFRCFLGQFEFKRLAFGLKTAPATYQRLMSHILSGYTGKFCHCFIDDIICYSNTFEEHLTHLHLIFTRLKEAGIKLKPSKCVLAKETVRYLGHVISPGEIRPDPDNVSKIRDLAPPKTLKHVRTFLGMASYYRSFVKDFSRRARALTELTKKRVAFRWGPEEEEAFEDLKKALTEEPVLALPDFSKPFILMTDGSSTGLGAVLGQYHEGDTKERVIGYASRRTNRLEQNYSACEVECLALVWATKHFREYILGRTTEVLTDHWALKWLQDLKTANPRLQRWRMALQEYDLKISHKPGAQHRNADFLSRMYEDEETDEEMDDPDRTENPPIVGSGTEKGPNSQPTVAAITRRQAQVRPESPSGQDARTPENHPRTHGIGRQALARLQKEDDDCQGLRKAITDGTTLPSWAQNHIFKIRGDGVLERMSDRRHDDSEESQVVLPQELIKAAVQDAHAGHLKTGKTLGNLKKSFFFRNMYAICTKYIEGCQTCQQKDRGRKALAPLGDMPQPLGAWHTVGVDVLGPLPQTKKGNKYVIVITDYLTRFVLAVATRDQTAETTAHALMEKFLEYGLPERLITDNGPNFRSRVLAQMCHHLRTAHLFTTPYHPQFDGLCKRFNRTMASMLRGFVSDHQGDWDLYLPYLLHAYRRAPQESTKETPFFLMFGRPCRAPLDLCLRPTVTGYPDAAQEIDRAKPEAVVRMHEAFKTVQGQLRDAHERQKRNHDKNCKERHFSVGDEVLLLDERVQEGQTKKLHAPWKPGYRIIEEIGPLNYKIEHPSRRGRILRVHVNRLKIQKPEHVWPQETRAEVALSQPRGEGPRSRHLERWLQEERNKYQPFQQDHWSDVGGLSETETGDRGNREAPERNPSPDLPTPRGAGEPREPIQPRPGGTQRRTPNRRAPTRREAFETPILRRSERIRMRREQRP